MKKLYTEFLRQNKTVGIVACGISALITFFLTTGKNMANYKGDPLSITTGSVAYIYIGIMVIFAIAMTVSSFAFLNNRNSSDFYHSIPVKRNSLYVVICLSILTWIGIISVAGTVFFGLMCFVLKYISIDIKALIKLVLCTIECGIFIASLVTLAMSISGNVTSYVFAAFVILVVPRALVLMIIAGISATNIYFPMDDMTYGMMNINVVTSYLYRIISNQTQNYNIFLPYIGTIAESLVYIVLGIIAFNRRKSESAGKSCISNVVQCILRIGITLVVSFAANYMIISGYGENSSIVFIIMVYTGALVVYFLYELITTKNLKRVALSIRQIPIVVVITVIGFFLMVFYSKKVENYRVDYNKTKSITIEDSYDQSLSYVFDNRDDAVIISDNDIVELLADAYNESMADDSDFYGYNLKVRFNDGGTGHMRYVYIDDEDINEIIRYVFNKNIGNIRSEIYPAYNKKHNNIYSYDSLDMTQDEMISLYNVFRNEVSAASSYADVLTTGRETSIMTIQVEDDSDEYNETVAYAPLSLYTPDSLNLLNKIINNRSTIKYIDQYMEKADNEENSGLMQFVMYDENNTPVSVYLDEENLKDDEFNEIIDILKLYPSDGIVQNDNPLVFSATLYTATYYEPGDYWTSITEQFMGIFNLSDEDYKIVLSLLRDITEVN